MKLLDSDFELICQAPGMEGGLRMIEKIGRTCYQSEDRITEDSYKGFVDRMIKSGHLAMLEFFTVYLEFKGNIHDPYDFYSRNPYSRVEVDNFRHTLLVTTNYRVIIENSRESDLKFLSEIPLQKHPLRTTVRLHIGRGISHEVVRHRVGSYAQSSQRYVCYSKERFGGEIEFIIPDKLYRIRDEIAETIDPLTHESREYVKALSGYDMVRELTVLDRGVAAWVKLLEDIERDYRYLTLEEEWAAEDARDILPNATKTILNVCMFNEDWKHFLDLRYFGTTGKPHPDMKRISEKIYEHFKEDGIL